MIVEKRTQRILWDKVDFLYKVTSKNKEGRFPFAKRESNMVYVTDARRLHVIHLEDSEQEAFNSIADGLVSIRKSGTDFILQQEMGDNFPQVDFLINPLKTRLYTLHGFEVKPRFSAEETAQLHKLGRQRIYINPSYLKDLAPLGRLNVYRVAEDIKNGRLVDRPITFGSVQSKGMFAIVMPILADEIETEDEA